jgi:hypothetical protein
MIAVYRSPELKGILNFALFFSHKGKHNSMQKNLVLWLLGINLAILVVSPQQVYLRISARKGVKDYAGDTFIS